MAINDVAGEKVYQDILPEFLGHNFVSGLHTLKLQKTYKPKNLKKNSSKKLGFSSPNLGLTVYGLS